MSEILARIRVRETAGIRRFLYPLMTTLPCLVSLKAGGTKTLDEVYSQIAVRTAQGQNVPSQIGCVNFSNRDRVDFAASLAPHEAQEVILVSGSSPASVSDPLRVTGALEGGLRSVQERFALAITPLGCMTDVVYDGVKQLRGATYIRRNNQIFDVSSSLAQNYGVKYPLSSQLLAKGRYGDNCFAQTQVAITACKSWAMVTHRLEQPNPQDEVVFNLPLAITSPTLTCDFGVGGGIYGKLNRESAPEVVWRTELGELPHARWSVATAGRTDYVGEVETAEVFLPQRWFHLIDSDKALAVAITKVQPDCREMTVRLTHEGDVSIAFRLGETITGPAEFCVCYHFLNDVPAIAAATNPQSILLPPVVEVLPV